MLVDGSATVGGKVTFASSSNVLGSWTVLTTLGAAPAPTSTATLGNIILTGNVSVVGQNVVANVTGLDFTNGQSGTNAALGSYLNRSYASVAPNLIANLFNLSSAPALSAAYNQLAPGQVARTGAATIVSGLSFANRLMSCPTNEGANVFIREGQCVWAVTDGQRATQKSSGSDPSSEMKSARIAAGAQYAIAPDLFAGFALSYNSVRASTAAGQSSTGDEYSVGATVKYNAGPLLLAAAVTGATASYKNTRNIAFGDLHETAVSSPDVSRVGGRLRSAYLFDLGGAYLKPMVDVDLQNVRVSASTETGSANSNLRMLAANHWVASASPAVEVGGQMQADGSAFSYRPFVRIGATAYSTEQFKVNSYFDMAGPSFGTFSTASTNDPVTLDLAAGVDILNTSAYSLKLSYDGRYGSTTKTHTAGFKAALQF